MTDDAREHYYVGRCLTCDWVKTYPCAPLKAKKETRSHAKRKRKHQTCVINLSTLEVIAKYELNERTLFDDVDDEPPF